MRRVKIAAVVGLGLLAFGLTARVGEGARLPPRPKAAEEIPLGVQGNYTGTLTRPGQAPVKASAKVTGNAGAHVAVEVVAGEGEATIKIRLYGNFEGGRASLTGKTGDTEWTGTLGGGKLTAEAGGASGGKIAPTLVPFERSPMEGKKPPADAIVLLPYAPGVAPSLAEWKAWKARGWQARPDGSMVQGGRPGPRPDLTRMPGLAAAAESIAGDATTVRKFRSMQLHLEFWCLSGLTGPGSGNLLLLDRYRIPIGGSCVLETASGGRRGTRRIQPTSDASGPAQVWQTYDITFHAPRFEGGRKTRNVAVTIVLNGVKIHDAVEFVGPSEMSAGGPFETGDPDVLRLEDNEGTVKFRNIWVVPLQD